MFITCPNKNFAPSIQLPSGIRPNVGLIDDKDFCVREHRFEVT